MKKPLLRMLWWVSVAAFGEPVVPEVNWMLMGSSNCVLARRSARVAGSTEFAAAIKSRPGIDPAGAVGPALSPKRTI